jgi:hypothetical protein
MVLPEIYFKIIKLLIAACYQLPRPPTGDPKACYQAAQ